MRTIRHADGGEPAAPARAAEDASLRDIVRWLAASRRRRNRRLTLVAVAAISFIATMAASRLLFQHDEKPLVVSELPARDIAGPQAMAPAVELAPSPSPRTVDNPSSSRQMLSEILAGRDRQHSVTAWADPDEVRINSSRPGYVYVLTLTDHPDTATRSIALLFPTVEDTRHRIQPGQALALPAREWPASGRFLVLVSEERRRLDGLGPPAGTVVCGSTTPCSASYGAVLFSRYGVGDAAGRPTTSTAPGARLTSEASRRCSGILERASLGEALTDEEQIFLRNDCR
jgi:hypothetical protein